MQVKVFCLLFDFAYCFFFITASLVNIKTRVLVDSMIWHFTPRPCPLGVNKQPEGVIKY